MEEHPCYSTIDFINTLWENFAPCPIFLVIIPSIQAIEKILKIINTFSGNIFNPYGKKTIPFATMHYALLIASLSIMIYFGLYTASLVHHIILPSVLIYGSYMVLCLWGSNLIFSLVEGDDYEPMSHLLSIQLSRFLPSFFERWLHWYHDQTDSTHTTKLLCYAAEHKPRIINMLFMRMLPTQQDYQSALKIAIYHENIIAIKKLIEHQTEDLNPWSGALHFAVLNNKSKAVIALMTAANIENRDEKGMTPLALAAQHNYQACLIALIRGGANINSHAEIQSFEDNIYPLDFAIDTGNIDMMKTLLCFDAFKSDNNLLPTKNLRFFYHSKDHFRCWNNILTKINSHLWKFFLIKFFSTIPEGPITQVSEYLSDNSRYKIYHGASDDSSRQKAFQAVQDIFSQYLDDLSLDLQSNALESKALNSISEAYPINQKAAASVTPQGAQSPLPPMKPKSASQNPVPLDHGMGRTNHLQLGSA